MAEEQVTLTIDDVEITAPKGATVFQAAQSAGIKIPHFCYHPDLSIAGVCRMCLVDVEKMPKLATSCSTTVGEGMVVRTSHTSEKVRKAVQDVLELHFLNHPIDCPICDQAGECKLQDYYWEHGLYSSRLKEPKVTNPKHTNIGPMVVLDADRCILCSRCVRFCREVPGTEELCIVNRGDHAEIALGTGKKLDNAYSANVVDICPVGAHTLRDFRFQCRAWYLKKTPSVCPGCARGCSITVEHHRGKVFRLKPRTNPLANGSWMCDEGRLAYKRLYQGDRMEVPLVRGEKGLEEVSWPKALERAAELLGDAGAKVAGLGSPEATNEENYLFSLLLKAVGTDKAAVGTDWEKQGVDDDLLRRADLAPNRTGAQRILGDATLPAITDGASCWLTLMADPVNDAPAEMGKALRGTKIIALSSHATETALMAEVVLPVATFAEREGTYTNFQGLTQIAQKAVAAPGDARAACQVLAELIGALGSKAPKQEPSAVFGELVKKVKTFKGLKYAALGEHGAGKAAEGEANR
jgi:NADH-quinone oxidoreductase subunit G